MRDKSIDYDSVSRTYDQVRAGEPEMIFHLLEEFVPQSDSKVLDIGCGTGNNTLLFQKAVDAEVFGLDPSLGMLREALSKAPEIAFVQGAAEAIPFPAGHFDMLFMTEVVHHLRGLVPAMAETTRVLKAGGHLCIVTQSHVQIEQRMTSRFFPATVEIDKARYPDIPAIESAMSEAGFDRVWSKSFKFAPVILGEEYLETVSRKGYSMLHKIRDDDYQEGLEALKLAYEENERLDYSAGYTFAWGVKTG
ncbi:MAG: class I SAM-dependent methyltransferase [Candidatus Hermodarchaeota archaeon]